MAGSKIIVEVYSAGVARDGKKYLQGVVGNSDLICYSISSDGKEAFSMHAGAYSRKEGAIYDAFKRIVGGPSFRAYDAISHEGKTIIF